MKNKTNLYHVFTNGHDEYFTSLKKARSLFRAWSTEYGCARIYKRYKGEDEENDGDCIESFGPFPT